MCKLWRQILEKVAEGSGQTQVPLEIRRNLFLSSEEGTEKLVESRIGTK